MGVRAPADRRFKRAGARPSRRRRKWYASWRRDLRTLALIGLLAYSVVRAADLLVGASMLSIDRLVVSGNTRLSSQQVERLASGLRGQNILLADLEHWRDQLLASPWIREASLRRVLPSTVEVTIIERAPIGLGRLGGRLYLVDAMGIVIEELGADHADLDLPIIDGLSPDAEDEEPTTDAARVDLAAEVVREVRGAAPDLWARVSQIDVGDPYDAVVVLDQDPALIHLGREQFVVRLQSYLELAPVLRERVPRIDYVDMRFDERVYVRPAATAGRSPTKLSRTTGEGRSPSLY